MNFRLQINGLSLLVQEQLELDVFSEQLFCYTNRRRDRVKILVWERSSFVIGYLVLSPRSLTDFLLDVVSPTTGADLESLTFQARSGFAVTVQNIGGCGINSWVEKSDLYISAEASTGRYYLLSKATAAWPETTAGECPTWAVESIDENQ